MKLRLVRMSGRPVSPENLAEYEAEFKKEYDKILEQHGQDMLTVHQELLKLDEVLQNKWQRIESNDIPKSKKGWVKLLETYDAPIMLAKSAENVDELLLVIMDEPLA